MRQALISEPRRSGAQQGAMRVRARRVAVLPLVLVASQEAVGQRSPEAIASLLALAGAPPEPQDELELAATSVSQPEQADTARHGGGKVVRQASSLGAPRTGGLHPAPTRSAPALLPPRATWASPAGLGNVTHPQQAQQVAFAAPGVAAVRSSTPVVSKSPGLSRGGGVDDEELRSLEELAQFERPVLDLLQNYSGLSLERLDGMLYMSAKEPRSACSQGGAQGHPGAGCLGSCRTAGWARRRREARRPGA